MGHLSVRIRDKFTLMNYMMSPIPYPVILSFPHSLASLCVGSPFFPLAPHSPLCPPILLWPLSFPLFFLQTLTLKMPDNSQGIPSPWRTEIRCGLPDQAWMIEIKCRVWQWKGAGVGTPGPAAQKLDELCVTSCSLSLGLSFLIFMTVVPPAPWTLKKGGRRRKKMQREIGISWSAKGESYV